LLEGDCQSLLAADVLSKWPDLASLQRAGAATIRRFFHATNHRRMDRIEPLLAKLKTARALTTDEAVIIPSALVLRTLAAQLRALLPFLAQYDKVLRATFDQHPDADLFRSVPGAGEAMAPRLLTAFGSDRARFANAEAVSSFSGIAPVTKSSGKSFTHRLRYACAKFLRQSFHEFAAASIPHCAWAKAFYDSQRARNKGHHTAVRALAYK
jgi:transposase